MKKEIQNIILLEITVHGRVNQPDIIGAIFGQTEDTLGEELSLRKLQKEGNIGRIELDIHYEHSLTKGIITVPSYMDLAKTVIVGAALETINKIGPCTASAKIHKIENIKDLKVKQIKEHAKRVLQKFISGSIDSQELVNEVVDEVRMARAETYGLDKLPCGPHIDKFDEIVLVETEVQLRSLLKNNIKNVVAIGEKIPSKSLEVLCNQKFTILFVNRGRDAVVKKLLDSVDIDSISKPEPPKRILDLTSKEIHKAIRGATAVEQEVGKVGVKPTTDSSVERRRTISPQSYGHHRQVHRDRDKSQGRDRDGGSRIRLFKMYGDDKEKIRAACAHTNENEACVLDRKLQLLGKVPVTEVKDTLASLREKVHAVVVNGNIEADLVDAADRNRVNYLVGKSFAKSSRRVRLVQFE